MRLFGLTLRKPSFAELTAAAVMGTGLWLAAVGLAYASGHPLPRGDAGALLVVVAWACIAVRLGLRIDAGRRELAANLGVAACLLGAYHAALAVTG